MSYTVDVESDFRASHCSNVFKSSNDAFFPFIFDTLATNCFMIRTNEVYEFKVKTNKTMTHILLSI